jgi:hypothetical protein
MTEDEWQTCDDPDILLTHARAGVDAGTLRMFAVRCCRRILPILSDELKHSLTVAERLARDAATDKERKAARGAAMVADRVGSQVSADLLDRAHGQAKESVALALHRKPFDAARYTKNVVIWPAVCLRWQSEQMPFPATPEDEGWKRYQQTCAEERQIQCDIFRQLVDYTDVVKTED